MQIWILDSGRFCVFFSNILNLKNLPSGPIFIRVLRIHDRYVFRGKVSDQTILILLLLSFPSQCLLVFCLCISRAETMDMEHQSLKTIILFIH